MFKKLLKILSFFLIGLLGLIILLLFFTQTSSFRDILKNQIISIADDQLNASLSIDKIEGNFYSSLSLSKLRIEKDETTMLYTDKIALNYDISNLFSNSIDISLIKIDSVYLFLEQKSDSTWNISELVKESADVEPQDTAESDFDWNIKLALFELLRSEVNIASEFLSSEVPEKIGDINFSASADLTNGITDFIVNTFRLKTDEPEIELKDLDVVSRLGENKIEIMKFDMRTALNRILFTAEYFPKKENDSRLNLITEPINFKEFQAFIPGLSVIINPVINIEGTYTGSSTGIDLSVKNKTQSIIVNASLHGIDSFPDYEMDILIDSLRLEKWTPDFPVKTEINALVSLKGRGNSVETLDAKTRILLDGSIINGLKLDTVNIEANLYERNLTSFMSIISEFGNINGSVKLDQILGKKIYDAEIDVNSLNISPITGDKNLESDINMSFNIDGEGFNPDSLNADLVFIMRPSSLMDYGITSVESKIKAENGYFDIIDLQLISQYADFSLAGELSPKKYNNLAFNLTVKDISSLPQFRQVGDISIAGGISGTLRGEIDSMMSDIDISFKEFNFQDYSAENISSKIELGKIKDDIYSIAETEISRINIDGTELRSIGLNAQFSKNELSSKIVADINDSSKAELISHVELDSIVTITINDFSYELSDYRWENITDTMRVILDDEQYTFNNIEFSNGEQSILIDGYINQSGQNNLRLKIDDLNVGDIVNLVGKDIGLAAALNMDMFVRGKFSRPEAEGRININELNYKNELTGSMDSEFGLKDEKLEYQLRLLINDNSINSEGSLPLTLKPDESNSVIPGNKPLNVSLDMDFTNLSPLSNFIEEIDNFDGTIKSELIFSNDLNNLDINGYFNIDSTSIISDSYGIDYNNIGLNFKAENKKYFLDDFFIQNEEGKLEIKGFAEFEQSPLTGNPNNLSVELIAKDFELAESRNLEAKIDGNIKFSDSLGNAKFDGNLDILRSRVFLPYFTETSSSELADERKPLLIRELERNKVNSDTAGIPPVIQNKESAAENEFVKDLRGRFKVSIPKNTWIVSPDMNIELSGEVDVVKNSDIFEFYGTMKTVRGKFTVLGKEFSIVKGQIILDGGLEIDPRLNVQLQYMFRGEDKSKKYLELFIAGTAMEPKLTFKVDEDEIDEGNAISYLLFGKSLDALSQSQKSNVKNSNEDLAKTIAGNLVAAQLKSTLGNALGLDVIEIKGNNNWEQASFTAGKYLTDDLYVSYEKGFGSSETNEINPSIFTLEYGLTSFLFFQLVEGNDKTAGFDFILKFDF